MVEQSTFNSEAERAAKHIFDALHGAGYEIHSVTESGNVPHGIIVAATFYGVHVNIEIVGDPEFDPDGAQS